MEYTPKRIEPIILDEGNIDGFDYIILSFGTHPAARIRIPPEHQFYKKIDVDSFNVDCHGGLEFAGDNLSYTNNICGWFIGWNYNKNGDYRYHNGQGKRKIIAKVKKWTTDEIKTEVENVIKQLIEKAG